MYNEAKGHEIHNSLHLETLGHSKLKVCFASEKYSKATRPPKLLKMFTLGSNFSVFHAHTTHHQFNDKSFSF